MTQIEKIDETIVSIIDAGTYSYDDIDKIRDSVFEALNRIRANMLINTGDTVLIKPNLVMDTNHIRSNGTDCLFTQPCVIEAVVEYVVNQLEGVGRIIIGDAPMQECVFENIRGLQDIVSKYKSRELKIELVDFREIKSHVDSGVHKSEFNPNAHGKIINLGRDSLFYNEEEKCLSNLRITNYDPRILPKHHFGEIHEYYISEYVLDADVIINMPKPKSHRKAGATIALKNFVGANTRKEFLPHHTIGSIKDGGDEYEKKSLVHSLRTKLFDVKNILEADNKYSRARAIGVIILFLTAILKFSNNPYSEGSWYGNDTISKTISDLNRIVTYADKNGKLCISKQRNIINVADMIISGEKEGPVAPSPKNVGFIAAGLNQVCFDEVISTMMGFDYHKIPAIVRARNNEHRLPLVNKNAVPVISSNIIEYDGKVINELDKNTLLRFIPTEGWKGHIELE